MTPLGIVLLSFAPLFVWGLLMVAWGAEDTRVALAARFIKPLPIAQQVIDLLGRDGWVIGPHEAKHPLGVTLWIANGRRHLRVDIEGRGRVLDFESKMPVQQLHIWRAFRAQQLRPTSLQGHWIEGSNVSRFPRTPGAA